MWELVSDLRYALRLWTKRPGVALVIVLTLALGIGANSAIFSVVDAVLLEPLPYREPERLVRIYTTFEGLGFDRFWVSGPEFLELRRWNSSFAEVGAYRAREVNLSGGEQSLRARGAVVTASLFRTLGVDASYGRSFTPEEDLAGGDPVVVLSWGLWHRAFGADPGLVGRTVEVDGVPRTVVGIMPPAFDLAEEGIEAFIPLALDPADPGGRSSHYLNLVGRLAEGVGLAQAREELAALVVRWEREFPDTHRPNPEGHGMVLYPLKEDLVGPARPAMLLLAGTVGLVLLIACANVANLLLARAEARQREVSIRAALGAGQGRLVRQFLTESALLALAGGVLGAVAGVWAVNAVVAASPDGIIRLETVGIDARLLAFTLFLALITGSLFGLAPAVHNLSRSFGAALKQGSRASVGSGRQRLRRALVVVEVALAALLVVGAGLLLKSFWTLSRVDPGFEARGALALNLSLPEALYPEASDVAGFYHRLLERLRSLPGVEVASAMTGLPPIRDLNANTTEFEGLEETQEGPPHNVDYYQFVTVDYFRTLKIPILEGRVFSAADAGGESPVALVNETMARVFWPGTSAVGRRVRPPFGPDTPWFTIVGVVGNVKQGGMDRPVGTELYFFADQGPGLFDFHPRTMNLVVRAAGDPLGLAATVQREVRRLDPGLPVVGLRTLEEVVHQAVAEPRFLTLLVGIFGFLALGLAAVGTYGVLSYSVEERRHEIGVRLALGAQAGTVLRLVLGQGMLLAATGLALGLAAALAGRRVLASLLYEVAPSDPWTFVTVGLLLAAVAALACLIPARRATRVDPLESLRVE